MSHPVLVMNRESIEWWKPSPGSVLISISGPGRPARLCPGWDEVLRLEFHDAENEGEVEHDPHSPGKTILFDEEMAEQVFNFVERFRDRQFIVHCDAGVSRSVAVGVFISEYLSLPLRTLEVGTTSFANARVLRLLHRILWNL